MKKTISTEFDYKDDGLWIHKNRGRLTLDEIQEACTEYYGSDEIVFLEIKTGYWDDFSQSITPPDCDHVKAYPIDVLERRMK